MSPQDTNEHRNIADEQIPQTGATGCSAFTERVITPGCSHHNKPGHDELLMDAVKFPTAVHLLMKKNQDLVNFNLEREIVKNVCVRTSSFGLRPNF